MFFATLMIASLLLAACEIDTGGTDDENGAETPQTESTDDGAETESAQTPAADDDDGTPTDITGGDGTPESDNEVTPEGTAAGNQADDSTPTTDEATPAATAGAGTGGDGWVVTASDAGEVEVDWNGQALTLVEARPSEGWDHSIDDEDDDDEFEVEFRQEGREIDFEAEIEDGRPHFELSDDWDDAEAGTYVVTLAGEVEFERDGDNLTLVEVRPNEDWDHRVDDEDDEEIEVDFRRNGDEASFEAEVEDGELDIDIDTEWYPEDSQ